MRPVPRVSSAGRPRRHAPNPDPMRVLPPAMHGDLRRVGAVGRVAEGFERFDPRAAAGRGKAIATPRCAGRHERPAHQAGHDAGRSALLSVLDAQREVTHALHLGAAQGRVCGDAAGPAAIADALRGAHADLRWMESFLHGVVASRYPGTR